MFSKESFVDFILKDPGESPATASQAPAESALPDGFEGFDVADTHPPTAHRGPSFARRLMEASGFGYAEIVQRDSVIRSNDAVARYLPERVSYWPKTTSRSYQTLLFEAELNHKQLLAIPAFRSRKMAHLDIVEDALARLVSEALEGFQRGGEDVTADVRKGRKEETLCVVSILDGRENEEIPGRLVCFGTQNRSTGGLETFQITEQTKNWDAQLAREHLNLLYERQFKKLGNQNWQEAFTTTEERKQADKLLAVCTRKTPKEHDIQESVLNLLDTIAKAFGLRKRSKAERRLQAFELPSDHDIGIDPEERVGSYGGKNPFGGATLRDKRSRLLGYIVYPLKSKSDARRLRDHLRKNNRFHNVLVVYPDEEHASLELWQGKHQMNGRLRKNQGYKDAAYVVNLLSRFFVVSKAKVRNPTELAQELAYRARYLRRLAVQQLGDEPEKGPLRNLFNTFKKTLIHDQTEDEFADAFAQTITYGLLTARWTGNDDLAISRERLTRMTALKYLPAASPFLNDLFKSALSVKLDEQRGRLLWLVDDIADLLDRVDVAYVFGIGDVAGDTSTDPVIHFYEPFLAAYDKQLKNKRGVFFTPRPVVSYIVRCVHEVLQQEFGLADGLASTDTWSDVAKRVKGLKIPEGVNPSTPYVCILDPATGTGTFLFECIEVIELTMKNRWCRELKKNDWNDPGVTTRWNEYVPKHLLPRLFGYELMMASYAVAHMKLSFRIFESGYRLSTRDRLRIYMTNSLEPASDSGQQKIEHLSRVLAREAHAVNEIKRFQHFTVLVGNPPYSSLSQNMGEWIKNLVAPFRFVDGIPIKEKGKRNHLQDDYVKFIRFALRKLEISGLGVCGLITNHGYLYSPTFRGMRNYLLKNTSGGRLIDLNGNAKRNDALRHPGDENIFDIQQGVAIGLFWMNGKIVDEAPLEHCSIFGGRTEKYASLLDPSAKSLKFDIIVPKRPFYLFEDADLTRPKEYDSWWKLDEVMKFGGTGIKTNRDRFVIDFEDKPLVERMALFRSRGVSDLAVQARLYLKENYTWKIRKQRQLFRNSLDVYCLRDIAYRPFDKRRIYYQKNVVYNPRFKTMAQAGEDNLFILACRQQFDTGFRHVLVTRDMFECCVVSNKSREITSGFPLYVTGGDKRVGDLIDGSLVTDSRIPNFSHSFRSALEKALGVRISDGRAGDVDATIVVAAEQVLAYIYGVLHSPGYRKRYAENLKMDFPRFPMPRSRGLFRKLAEKGQELISLHLLECSPVLDADTSACFVGARSATVEKVSWSDGSVWIDSSSKIGFRDVPKDVWEFRIGSYRVCEKWLKDRKDRRLTKNDIGHYRKIVAAISNTICVMNQIDPIVDSYDGWPNAFVSQPWSGGK